MSYFTSEIASGGVYRGTEDVQKNKIEMVQC